MECPYCGFKKCSKTILGNVEDVGSYVAGAGVGHLGKMAIGLLTGGRYIPKHVNTSGVRKEIPKQYKCENCGRTFHRNDYGGKGLW